MVSYPKLDARLQIFSSLRWRSGSSSSCACGSGLGASCGPTCKTSTVDWGKSTWPQQKDQICSFWVHYSGGELIILQNIPRSVLYAKTIMLTLSHRLMLKFLYLCVDKEWLQSILVSHWMHNAVTHKHPNNLWVQVTLVLLKSKN